MIKSESIAKVAAALSRVQRELRPAEENAHNPFFKSTYADLKSVWDSCRELLTVNGFSIVQIPGQLTTENITLSLPGGDRIETKASIELTTILMHESGEYIGGVMVIPLKQSDPQAAGSGLSYARRYAMAAMVGITTGEDDDGEMAQNRKTTKPKTTTKPPRPVSPPPPPTVADTNAELFDTTPPPTPPNLKALHAAGRNYYGNEWDKKRPELVQAITGGRVTSSKGLTQAEAQKLIDGINAKADGGQ